MGDDFKLPGGSYSVSDTQEYIEYIIKKYETIANNAPINICISMINNRLVFVTKDRNKLELRSSETMKLFGSTKKLMYKTKNRENVPSIEVVAVVLVQCNLVENQYQRKPEVLYTFALNK